MSVEPGPRKSKSINDQVLEVASVDFNEAEELLSENPNLYTQNDDNQRGLLHWAAVLGKERLVDLLLRQHKFNIDDEDDTGATALTLAALKGSHEICQQLLDHGADVNHQNKNGHNAVQYAGSKNHQQVLLLLLERGGDVNARDHLGETALHRVASMENAECLRLMLEHATMPVQINLQNKEGNTALHLACEATDAACALLLIDHGASIELENKAELIPLQMCRSPVNNALRDKLTPATSK